MTTKQMKIFMVMVLVFAALSAYLKYIDVNDMEKIRLNNHYKLISAEEFNNYVEEKELTGLFYNPKTNFMTGLLTESARIKHGLKSEDNGLIMLGNVTQVIQSGEISNIAIKDKVDTTTSTFKNSYRGIFGTYLLFGYILMLIIHFVSSRIALNREINEIMGMQGNGQGIQRSSRDRDSTVGIEEIETGVKLNDIKGHDEIMEDISFVIKMIKNPEKYEKLGAKVPNGVLLQGPPGTGKTMIAKAIATEVGIPFYAVGGSDFVEKYVGVGAKRIRDLFAEAKKQEKAIIYIDEIDAIGKKRGDNDNDERTGTLNALLMEMDGFSKNSNLLVIASTNRVDILDDALLRPGRFDKHLSVNNPDMRGRLEILTLYSKDKKLDKDVDLGNLAKITRGFSGAELSNILNEAAMLTAFRDKSKTTKSEIDDAFFKIVTKGDKKKNYERSLDDTVLTAWHEAGHAVVSKLLADQTVNTVTIIPSTSGAGGLTLMEPKDNDYYSKIDLENMVKISYGGRAAEYLLLKDENKVTTGASNDIDKATNIIKGMLGVYGMSPKFGLLNLEKMQGLNQDYLINEAKELSLRLYSETITFLESHYDLLKEMSEWLIEKETLDEADITELIRVYQGVGNSVKESNIIIADFSDSETEKKKSGLSKLIPSILLPESINTENIISQKEE